MSKRIILALAISYLAATTPAHAELAYFSGGRTISVKGHRLDGDRLVLEMRGGGEIVCDAAVVMRFAPDEVLYPEPVPDADVLMQTTGADRGRPDPHSYDPIIDRAAAKHGVDAKLVRAVIQVESAYDERATSPKGAKGLMQLMPETARQYAVKDPYDPVDNIDAGIRHLKMLLSRFPVRLAIAAYNAGETAVQRFKGIPPYPETRVYVQKVLALVRR